MALHDEQSEGLDRSLVIKMVQTASGGKLTREQATNTWQKTIHPFGMKLGLLTGCVKTQEGTSKRTASGAPGLQRRWHAAVSQMIADVRDRAHKKLQDEELVDQMMPWLIVNLDEECLRASAANAKVVGSARIKKHDNQAGTSRFVARFCFSQHIVDPHWVCAKHHLAIIVMYTSPVGANNRHA